MTKSFDFIIIGSGFGGSVASLRLAEKGYTVLVIEKGKRFLPEDFPRTNWNLRKYLWIPSLRCFGFQKLSFYPQASILSGVGLGGGSLVYANTLFKPPNEFFEHPSWVHFRDWRKTLEPYYKKAGFMLGRIKYPGFSIEDRVLLEISTEMGREKSFQTVDVGVFIGETNGKIRLKNRRYCSEHHTGSGV